jgi:hypothetical protein
MKEKILQLRKEGKSYNEICDILQCSKSTVSWHCCNKSTKKSILEKRNNKRIKDRRDLKILHGGKCFVCGYYKCLRALEFHHKNPKQKKDTVGNLMRDKGVKAAHKESKKCVLLCGNCHCELEEGLIYI